jgi:hypothetical protein
MNSASIEQQLDAYRAAGAGRPAADPAHWSRYAAAAGSALAFASSADATTIYTVANATYPFANFGTAAVNLDGGATDATFDFTTLGTAWVADVTGFDIAATVPGGQALKLALGDAISNALSFLTQANVLSLATLSSNNGPWGVGSTGFLGLKTDQGNFGWIRLEFLNTDADKFPEFLRIVDYAYNDNGQPINAGDGIPPNPVPAPAPLALLAIGAAGIAATRRQRAARG